ncbi:hypothetical protein BGW41_000531, partial [Actinomortierella wolfii]
MSASASSNINSYGVTDEQVQDMREVFEVFTSQRGVNYLDTKRMRLAMRALGFEPSRSEVQEMVGQYFSTKSSSKAGGKSSSSKRKNGGKSSQAVDALQDDQHKVVMDHTERRKSTRRAAQVAQRRPGAKSVYVDDSDDDIRSLDDDDDDDNNNNSELDSDAYVQKTDNEDEDDEDDRMMDDMEGSDMDDDDRLAADGEVRIHLDDFIRIVAPQLSALYDDQEIDRIFQLFDTEGKGAIDIQDLRRVSKELGFSSKDQELREMIEEADKDGDQRVNR